MTTDDYKKYIQLTHINRLEHLMGNDTGDGYWRGPAPAKNTAYVSVLHDMMLPYYEQYLYGDTPLCKPNMQPVYLALKPIINDDTLFGQWASEQNLLAAAEGWGENMKRIQEDKRISQYFFVLEALLRSGCRQDWLTLSDELKRRLNKYEVMYDYRTDEVLCVLHAFCQIMMQEWTQQKKEETLELLRTNWLFMKYYYSVMTRHIVGVKFTDFCKVTKTVLNSSQSFKPHMHIYYCGLVDIADDLNLDRKQRRELDKLAAQMLDELQKVEPSDMLYELCDALFPEDFQRLLRDHRPKTYGEVEEDVRRKDELIKQLGEQKGRLQQELDRTREVLQQMVEASIPIEEVDAELMKYPPSMAWQLLCQLNESPILNGIDAWRNAYPSLLEKYRNLLVGSMNQQKDLVEAVKAAAERPTTQYNYSAGAVHDDNRRQFMLGEKRADLLHQNRQQETKQLTDE